MKRCPQCEFIYEDDQTCCDMDGIDLVFDHQAVSGTSESLAAKPAVRRSVVASIVGVVFGVVVLAVGYASLERAISQNPEPPIPAPAAVNKPTPIAPKRPTKLDPISENAVETAEVATVATNPEVEAEPVGQKADASQLRELQPANTPANRLALPKLPRAKVQNRTTSTFKVVGKPPVSSQAQAQPTRKDSKLVSMVKKTGRFFTKPFKRS
jgi:hypothetical protein